MYTNADCLLNKMPELEARIQHENPHLIAITEYKPKNARFIITDPELKINGYQTLRTPAEKNGRGCLVYIRNDLEANPTEMKTNYEDAIILEIRLTGHDKLMVGCIYRSPNSSEAKNSALLDLLKELEQANHTHKLIVGDFNFPQIDWRLLQIDRIRDADVAEKFLDTVMENYWHQHIDLQEPEGTTIQA